MGVGLPGPRGQLRGEQKGCAGICIPAQPNTAHKPISRKSLVKLRENRYNERGAVILLCGWSHHLHRDMGRSQLSMSCPYYSPCHHFSAKHSTAQAVFCGLMVSGRFFVVQRVAYFVTWEMGGPPRTGPRWSSRPDARRGQRLVRAVAIRLDCWRSDACGHRVLYRVEAPSSKLVVNWAVTCSQAAKYRRFKVSTQILPWHTKSSFFILSSWVCCIVMPVYHNFHAKKSRRMITPAKSTAAAPAASIRWRPGRRRRRTPGLESSGTPVSSRRCV